MYVSDRVGETDFSLLRRLVLPDGTGGAEGWGASQRWKLLLLPMNLPLPCPVLTLHHPHCRPHPARSRSTTAARLIFPAVLRCMLPGRPTPGCLFSDISRDKRTVLKVSGEGGGGFCAGYGLRHAEWRRALSLQQPSRIPALQVWNLNRVTGVVGLFNVQASWPPLRLLLLLFR